MAKTDLLEVFLSAARGVHGTGGGTKETSYYTAINNLLDGVGDTLKPKVRCVMQLKNLAEVMEVTAMARRLAALVLLQNQLDANYQAVAADTWVFDKAS